MSSGPSQGGILFVLSGPSGVGKDTVIARLKERGLPIHYCVTVTTRAMRQGEVHGVNYFFVSPEEFERMRSSGELLESALVHGYCYGTPRAQVRDVLASGRDVVLKVDVQGAATVKRKVPDAVFIFLAPESFAELKERLQARGTESTADLSVRLKNARQELADLPQYDYVVVNYHDRLDETVDKVSAIITAEHCRVRPRHIVL